MQTKTHHDRIYVTEEEPFETQPKALQSFYSSKHDNGAESGRGEGYERCGGDSGEPVR